MSELKLLDGYSIENAAELPQMSFPKMFRLALRTWPYMEPMLPHLLVLLAYYFSGGLLALLTGLIGTDLFTNKVLVGDKLQPIQAIVLFVGDEYVTTDPEKLGKGVSKKSSSKTGTKTKGIVIAGKKGSSDLDDIDIEPELTQEQRRVVRNRLILWGIFGGFFGTIIGMGMWYYSTWVWQSINQNLRVAMVERAENLSLKYHNNARVGDAISGCTRIVR